MVHRIFLKACWSVLFSCLVCAMMLAQPRHDLCEQAVPIQPGETLFDQTNRGASIAPAETPEGLPVTCIQTFENDLWYSFESEPGFSWYQVVVMPYECTTPAGLQALIIQADNCETGSFIYRDCANPRESQQLELTVRADEPGTPFLIYVDGYDGTECGFVISLKGFEEDPRSVEDLARAEMDYGGAPPLYEPVNQSVMFRNNLAVIAWEDESNSSTVLFQVQRVFRYSGRQAGTVIGTVQPSQTVGAATTTYYELTDQQAFVEEQEYCYRIVKIDDRGSRAYSEPVCSPAELIETFWVSEVFETTTPGLYQVQYNTQKRQDLRFALFNEEGEELKALEKKREPKGDGIVQISMEEYPPGTYELRASGDDGTYRRVFFRQP